MILAIPLILHQSRYTSHQQREFLGRPKGKLCEWLVKGFGEGESPQTNGGAKECGLFAHGPIVTLEPLLSDLQDV
jgi:hypothetical protein